MPGVLYNVARAGKPEMMKLLLSSLPTVESLDKALSEELDEASCGCEMWQFGDGQGIFISFLSTASVHAWIRGVAVAERAKA